MAISQQQHQPSSLAVSQQAGDMKQNTVKPRKRKGKQQHQSNEQRADQVQKSAVEQPSVTNTNTKHNVESPPLAAGVSEATDRPGNSPAKKLPLAFEAAPNNPLIVPTERTTLTKNKQIKDSVCVIKKQETSNGLKQAAQSVNSETPSIGKHKQLVLDEAEDIDAGIELDGSSNSGSSVKDIGEDQKSASVSPVMAQVSGSTPTEIADSHATSSVTKQTAEVTSLEKADGSMCAAAKSISATTDEPSKVKKFSSLATKQQLAANQQVIDADEQQLQQRLQNKQKRLVSQDSGASLDDNSILTNDKIGLKKAQATTDATNQETTNDKMQATRAKPRRFSSQSSQEAADTSSCKVCSQHVYQMEKMLAEKSIYHKRCFRCHQCKIQLRVDNYSSHEGQVYCKAHHRQIFQPQVKLDNGNDVDIVAKSSK